MVLHSTKNLLIVAMMSPSNPVQVPDIFFVPKDLVTVQVGRLSASCYPKIKLSMPIFERAHAFQVTKSALVALPIDTRLILNAMGTQLNCSTIVDGLMHECHC